MSVPKKRRTSSSRKRRQSQQGVRSRKFAACSNCGATRLPHKACAQCGFYRGSKRTKAARKKPTKK